MVEMTAKALKEITKELKQYSTPSLNDKLYLHFKGWKKIEPCISEYTGVRALWLEGNGLQTLENLNAMAELRCLYVQQNLLTSFAGLEHNLALDAINACNNSISSISHLEHLPELHTLQLAHNRLETAADLEHLTRCPSISVLDIQNNRIDDPAIVEVLAAMPDLHVLQMQGNPVTRKIQHYRKTIVARCTGLTYLDDRPVFEDERRTVTAWARGGVRGGKRKMLEEKGNNASEDAEAKTAKEDNDDDDDDDEVEGEEEAVSGEEIRAAMAEGWFDTKAAHAAEKGERTRMRREKEEKERRNREAFEEMLADARVRRLGQILPHCRLLKGLPGHVIEELARRTAAAPLHANRIIGFAKEEVAVTAGEEVKGLHVILKGKIGFVRAGGAGGAGEVLSTGQYFGEVALAASKAQVATMDAVARDYSEVYVLSRDALLQVARAHPAALPLLQANRSAALRCQWQECKPWAAYELTFPRQASREAKGGGEGGGEGASGKLPEGPGPAPSSGAGERGEGGEKEKRAGWTEEDDFVAELAAAQSESLRRPRAAPRSAAALAAERKVEAGTEEVARWRGMPSVVGWAGAVGGVVEGGVGGGVCRGVKGRHEVAKSVYVEGDEEEEEEEGGERGAATGVRVSGVDGEYEAQRRRVEETRRRVFAEAGLGTEGEEGGGKEEEEEEDGPPELEEVDVEAIEQQLAGGRGLWGEEEKAAAAASESEEEEEGEEVVVRTPFVTQYALDNAGTQGEYNRDMEAAGVYDRKVGREKEGGAPVAEEGVVGGVDALEMEGVVLEEVSEGAEEEIAAGGAKEGYSPADAFVGSRAGWVFKMGEEGLGYYLDAAQRGEEAEEEGGEEEDVAGAGGYQDGDMDALD